MEIEFEKKLVKLVNEYIDDVDFILEDNEYQKCEFYVYDEDVVKNILSSCKFKSIGSVFDYPNFLPQPESIDGIESLTNRKFNRRLAISNKLKAIVYYNSNRYSIICTFFIDRENLFKLSKKIKKITQKDTGYNLFRDVDFHCGNGKYIDVSDATATETERGSTMSSPVNIVKKTVANENLVFDEKSTINEVMKDINNFFKKETKTLYEKLELPYKRGLIIYGDPGNGKSAMIREIIRTVGNIAKVVINGNVLNVTKVLRALLKALDNKPAIVIIEDLDSFINEHNRSEILNILDGINVTSGVLFIGTTNYPEAIDPAFMNRSGRFDRSYNIENPSDEMRRKFFDSRNIGKLFSEYDLSKNSEVDETKKEIVNMFVKYSKDLPMSNLKELITSTAYKLASRTYNTIEEALISSYENLKQLKEEHNRSHTNFKNRRFGGFNSPIISTIEAIKRVDDDDEDDD